MKSDRIYNRNSFKDNYKLHKSVDHRSEYLAGLAKRKSKNKELLKMMKMSQFYDELLEDVPIVRDYSFFSNKNQTKKLVLPKIFRPDVKINIVSEMEKKDPNKYKKKDIVMDKFSKMYLNGSNSIQNGNNFPTLNVNRLSGNHQNSYSKNQKPTDMKIEEKSSETNSDKNIPVSKSMEKLFLIEKYPEKGNSSYYKVIKDGNTKVLKKPVKIYDYLSNIKTLKL